MRRIIFPLLLMFILVALLPACSPATPIQTAQPTPTPITGWEKFTGGGAELWLPESFTGGDLSTDLDVIIEKLTAMGPNYQAAAQMVEANKSAFVMWIFDEDVGERGALTNVNVVREKVVSAVNIDNYMDAVASQLPADFRVTNQGEVSQNGREAGRLEIEMEPSIKEIMFIYKIGGTMWVITYATGMSEFASRLPDFEKSAATFQVNP